MILETLLIQNNFLREKNIRIPVIDKDSSKKFVKIRKGGNKSEEQKQTANLYKYYNTPEEGIQLFVDYATIAP